MFYYICNIIIKHIKMKKCSKCGEIKEISLFPKQDAIKIMSHCKECRKKYNKQHRQKDIEKTRQNDRNRYKKNAEHRREYARNYRKNNPEKTRETHLKSKYGITTSDYNNMLNNQNNKCAVCERDMNDYGKVFCVDHNHTTNKIRGLVCDPCNYGIGFYEKHKDKYIKYLLKYD